MVYESPKDLVKRQILISRFGARAKNIILYKLLGDVNRLVYSLHFEKQVGRLYFSPKCIAHLGNGLYFPNPNDVRLSHVCRFGHEMTEAKK